MMWCLWLACGLWSTAPAHTVHADVGTAIDRILSSSPRVLAVGEIHATQGGPAVPSTLARFTDDLLPVLAPRLTDVVFETWVVDGQCGGEDVAAADAVQEGTARPEVTESEIARAARRTRELGVSSHALSMSCEDIDAMHHDGEVDYGALLSMLTDKLGEFADKALALDGTVLLYGGAIHNDRTPAEGTAKYSYAHTRKEGLVELDIYVPEILEARTPIQESWWPLVGSATSTDHVVLIERAPNSFVLLLPRTASR